MTPYRIPQPLSTLKEPLRLNLRKRLLTSPITGVFLVVLGLLLPLTVGRILDYLASVTFSDWPTSILLRIGYTLAIIVFLTLLSLPVFWVYKVLAAIVTYINSNLFYKYAVSVNWDLESDENLRQAYLRLWDDNSDHKRLAIKIETIMKYRYPEDRNPLQLPSGFHDPF